jgi:hypothetical protein
VLSKHFSLFCDSIGSQENKFCDFVIKSFEKYFNEFRNNIFGWYSASGIATKSIMTFSITALRIITLRIMALSKLTLSMMTLCITTSS